jgi:hypothetical protein
MLSSRAAAVVMIVPGLLAYLIAPYGIYHYRDEAAKRAGSYIREHLHDYHSGDFKHTFDSHLKETRVQRAGFYLAQFGGFILACWGVSSLRQRPPRRCDMSHFCWPDKSQQPKPTSAVPGS